jgi:diguanylate cyclase (GGDEF)-like protein
MDRKRMLDMEHRIKPLRLAAMGVLALALLICGPWLGYWTLLPLALATVGFGVADRLMENSRRPEFYIFGAWVASECILSVAVALTGGPNVATIAWLALPVSSLGSRFPLRAIALGMAIALALLFAVAFGVDARAVLDEPPLLIAPATLIISVGLLSIASMRSDVEHRAGAFVDPLTGALNRTAMQNRVAELAQQSAITGEPIAAIMCDLDHFKDVNDTFGHPAGDAVLRDVAYALRRELRAYDLAYRVGGEEFLVLLPGAGLQEGARVAESLRAAVAAESHGGQPVTMSFGVAATSPGERFDPSVVIAQADAALYAAKDAGRNRVHVTPTETRLAA